MLTQLYDTVICPNCKKEIYPQEAYHNEYLCGEQLCPPSPKLERILGCHMRYFCSEGCYKKVESSPRSCNITYWSHWMDRIIKAGSSREGS